MYVSLKSALSLFMHAEVIYKITENIKRKMIEDRGKKII